MAKEPKAKLLASGFYFLEGPRWRAGWLWMSDMVGRKVYRVSLNGTVEFVVDVPGRPSGLGFLPDGTPLVVSMRDRRLFRIERNKLVLHVDLSGVVKNELNDMVVDELGRAYVGSFGFDRRGSAHLQDGILVLVEPAGNVRIVARNLAFPNGCVITGEPRRLVLAETFGRRLTAFDIVDDGSLINRSLYADLKMICPDGICLDGDGGIWVADAERPEFVRVLEGGQATHQVRLPGRQAIACQVNGSTQRTLFCLTADQGFEDVEGCTASARVDIVDISPASPPGRGSVGFAA